MTAVWTSSARAYTVTKAKPPSTRLEWLHIARAFCWIPLTAAVFAAGWHNDTRKLVIVTLIYSAYANFESGLATWQGRRAERRSLENP